MDVDVSGRVDPSLHRAIPSSMTLSMIRPIQEDVKVFLDLHDLWYDRGRDD